MLFILSLAASCVLQVVRAAPAPQGDKFGPQGEFGSAVQAAGDVPNGPAPEGCSKYELIYDMKHFPTFNDKPCSLIDSASARETGEPGTFGVIAGDQLVNATTKALPGARGYVVQVIRSTQIQEFLLSTRSLPPTSTFLSPQTKEPQMGSIASTVRAKNAQTKSQVILEEKT